MKFYNRKSIRLKGYNYAQEGAYFVTICVQEIKFSLGKISNGGVDLNCWGKIVNECWHKIPIHFPNVRLGKYIIMPDHIHGIITVVGAGFPRPKMIKLGAETAPVRSCKLGQIIAFFKYQSTKRINVIRNMQGSRIWQRNYYDRIIRDYFELVQINEYIKNNPVMCNPT